MDAFSMIERLFSNVETTSRRQFLKRSALIGISVPVVSSLLAACGGDDDDDDDQLEPTAADQANEPPATSASDEPTDSDQTASEEEPTVDSSSETDGEVKRGGTLRVGTTESPTRWDLHGTGLGSVYDILAPVYNTLITQDTADPTGELLVPDLATTWDVSDDSLTYTFTLHEGVLWHDGTPFTADDVVASMEKIINPPEDVLSARDALFDSVASVTAPDDLTVEFQLSFPDAAFLEILAIGWNVIYPKHIMDEHGMAALDAGDIQFQIGTGPFKVVEHQLNQVHRLEKNADYFKEGLPYLDAIEFQYIPDTTAKATAMIGGNLDIYAAYPGNLQGEDAEILAQERPDEIVIERTPLLSPIVLYLNVTKPPFDDIRVRQAISEALDRDAVNGALIEGGAVGGLVLPGSTWELPEGELAAQIGYGSDMEARQNHARELLAEAGYNDDNPLVINLIVRPSPDSARIGTIVQPMFEAIGAVVNIEQTTQARQAELRQTGEFEITVNLLSQTGIDPTHLYSTYLSCDVPRNQMGICLPDGDEMIQDQRQLSDFDDRKAIVDTIHKKYLQEAAFNVVSWRNGLGAYYNYVHGFGFQPAVYTAWGRMEKVWLDQ